MTPADKRMAEAVERWLTSIDLHLKYVELDAEAYGRVQAWPPHDRPTRWVLELARQKVLELKSQCETRVAMGDTKFAESLELMAFLANLVGSQHVQRFVPLASPQADAKLAPRPPESSASDNAKRRSQDPEATREMPRIKQAAAAARSLAIPSTQPKSEKPIIAAKAEAKKPTARAQARPAEVSPAASGSNALQTKIVTDAIRLMKWGRQWHELAELIARMADRPNITEVRRILRAHKAAIETQIGAEA